MKLLIYHGSESIIYNPIFGHGTSANDYGRGFYCTEDPELSKEWACKRNKDGFSNCYELNTKGLNICDLNGGDYSILNWMALLTKYRGYWQRKSIAEDAKDFLQEKYLIDISKFDVIKGYRADDSYFSFAQDFIMGTISVQKLSEAMRLGGLNEQIVLKSKRAFDQLSFKSYEEAEAVVYFNKKEARDLNARRSYQEIRPSTNRLDEIYILDIMRGNVKYEELRIF
ncbi:DUF3990 domain-containing protein [Butyrivibrio sp. FCS006]|uniref:DUF3990 domain-containing protein n=1 Tax=Butyrivibrio sp. FCS006 TaxID=1280684 RepID=UPI0006851B0E|nr:DUF3990 domain-containing protein [Butyrivibrio sp. FCS006]